VKGGAGASRIPDIVDKKSHVALLPTGR
jgi:hypothetical protein